MDQDELLLVLLSKRRAADRLPVMSKTLIASLLAVAAPTCVLEADELDPLRWWLKLQRFGAPSR